MEDFYMVVDNSENYYINNCGQGELLEIKPLDYFFSYFRNDNGKTGAFEALSNLSFRTKEMYGYRVTKLTVSATDHGEVVDYE